MSGEVSSGRIHLTKVGAVKVTTVSDDSSGKYRLGLKSSNGDITVKNS